MMGIGKLVGTLFFLGLAGLGKGEVTEVKFVPCTQSFLEGKDECLKITIRGGDGKTTTEYAGLTYFDEDYTKDALDGPIFTADGKEIAESDVSVSRDSDKQMAEVMIRDPNDQEFYKVEVNLKTGELSPLEGGMEDGNEPSEPLTPGDDRSSDSVRWRYAEPLKSPEDDDLYNDDDRALLTNRNLPSSGFRMRLQIVYDGAFSRKYGNNANTIRAAIDRILVHAKNYFLHSSLKTKMYLDVLPYRRISETLTPTVANIRKFRTIANRLQASGVKADSFSALSYDGNRGGILGIAYVGTTCNPSYRVNMNKYFQKDTRTASIIVHEIGHNLGMYHDFNDRDRSARKSSKGEQCKGIGGFMDYTSNPNKWSPCSVEDFTKYYNRITRGGRSFCLKNAGSGTNPITTVRPPTRPTVRPPTGTCSDDYSYCSSFKNYCRRYGSLYYFIQLGCKNTCGFCQTSGTFKCQDTRTSDTCAYVVRRGLCSGNGFWQSYGRLVCRKTCKLC